MSDYEQAVFVSYAWGGESEKLVNKLDKSLQARGIKIVRDKRDLGYKGMIREFMARIGQGNAVIAVISDKYLRSKNCMFELVEIADHKQFLDRVFPIVLSGARIYDPVEHLDYVRYWQDEKSKLNKEIKKLKDVSNLQGINEELNDYDRFRDKISGLASTLKDMNTLTPGLHQKSDFDELAAAIEKRMHKAATAVSKRRKAAKPSNKQSPALNNSISTGSIQIGGNVGGNFVIGNNNKVSNKKS